MNQAVRKYRKKLRKVLYCGTITRTRLLEQFDDVLVPFLEECPEPNLNDLYAAFGAPKQMAQELMQDVPQEERNKWKRRNQMKKVIPYVVIILLLAACAGIYALKLQPVVIEEQETIIIGERNESIDSFEERTGSMLE